MNTVLKVVSSEVVELNSQIEALKAQMKALQEAKKQHKGITLSTFEYGEGVAKRCGVTIRGLGRFKHDFFAQQIQRLVEDTPDAEMNRKAIRDFIEANKEKLSWLNKDVKQE